MIIMWWVPAYVQAELRYDNYSGKFESSESGSRSKIASKILEGNLIETNGGLLLL